MLLLVNSSNFTLNDMYELPNVSTSIRPMEYLDVEL